MKRDGFIDFKNTVYNMIKSFYTGDVVVEMQDVRKNNGVILSGLNMRENGKKHGTVIYLEQFYEEYKDGMEYDEIVLQLIDVFDKNKNNIDFDIDEFQDFLKASKRIVYKVVSYSSNLKMLEGLPYRRILDLAIIYFYVGFMGDATIAGTIVNKEHMEMWETDEDTLYKCARENTPLIMPEKLTSMQEALNGIIPFEHGIGEKCLDIMYVLTNHQSINGATCMLYPKVLADFACGIEEDLYIIPSSIHELIIMPKSIVDDVTQMRDLVHFVNATELMPEEVLSESVYYYNRAEGTIEFA